MKSRKLLFSIALPIGIFWLSIILDIAVPVKVNHNDDYDKNAKVNTAGSSFDKEGASYLAVFSEGQPTASIGNRLYITKSNTNSSDINESNDNSSDSSTTDDSSADINMTVAGDNGTDGFNEADDGSKPASNDDTTAAGNNVPDDSDTDVATSNPAQDADETLEEPSKYANIGISIANNYVNIRKEPDTESEVLGKLYNGAAAEIISTDGSWYLVESGSVKGYIRMDYLKTGIPDDELIKKYGTLTARVICDGLNVREKPDIESRKLTVIYQNEKYPIMELLDEWAKVDIKDDNVIGYVKIEYIEVITTFKDAVSKEEEQELLRLKEEERIKKETQIKYRKGMNYTEDDLKLLACLVHSEAGDQRYEGKLAVANVVLNRVKSSKYPDTIKDVIYQPGQFAVVRSGSLQKQLDRYDSYSTESQLLSIKAAKAALEGANNIGNRLYFHTYSLAVKKGYHKKSGSVKLQDHLFW